MNFIEQLNTAVSKEHGWRGRAVSSLCKFLRVCETLKCSAKQTSKGSLGILIFYRVLLDCCGKKRHVYFTQFVSWNE